MPTIPYYLGRPAHVWIAAMSSRGSARNDNNSRAVRASTPPGRSTQPGAAQDGSAHPESASSAPQRGTLSPMSDVAATWRVVVGVGG
jgi:hypothetical protein